MGIIIIILIGVIATLVSGGSFGIFLLITFILDALWQIVNNTSKKKQDDFSEYEIEE